MQSSENSSLALDTQGAIFIEFLFVVLPFMILLLGLTQTALMYMGGLAVKRSAATAARAAMVVFDDDPQKYGGQGRNTLGGQREEAIKMAAAFPIFAIHTSPKNEENVEHALRAWGDSPYSTQQQIPDGLRVEFPGGVSSGRGSSITVRVSYDYPCEVPVVRGLMCPSGTIEISAQSTLPNHAANYQYGSW
jgi:hypothetical protein